MKTTIELFSQMQHVEHGRTHWNGDWTTLGLGLPINLRASAAPQALGEPWHC